MGGGVHHLKVRAGDVVLAHQKLPHRITENAAPHIRYQVYFRVSHIDHSPEGPFGDLFHNFDGLTPDEKALGTSFGRVAP